MVPTALCWTIATKDWDELLLAEVERQDAKGKQVAFGVDPAFAKPEIYDAVEQCDVAHAIRIAANEDLEGLVAACERESG